MTWKEFKNWLEKEITEHDGLQVKIRDNRQSQYGNLSPTILTNFCDSLEATLDKNSSYHLFSDFTEWGTFQDLFPLETTRFGKTTNQEKINRTDYDLLEKLFIAWRNKESQFEEDWQLQEAISQSLFASDLSPDELQMQEILLRSQLGYSEVSYLAADWEEKNVDRGWLTDDNITYILENDEVIKKAKNIQVKTDIANIYLQLQKAKEGETIDNDFWDSLDNKKKYVLLPLRVSGNHWGLLIFINNEYTGKVNWLYYISSLDSQAVDREIKEISNFLKQVGKKFGQVDNKIVNENNLSEMVFRQNPRQPNSYDCGVYLCKFIQFLCENEYYNLNDLQITEFEVKEFRTQWREKIGEDKWCKWDTENEQVNLSEFENDQLQKALTQSLLPTEDDQQLEQAILLSYQQNIDEEGKLFKKQSQNLLKEIDQPKEKKFGQTEAINVDKFVEFLQKGMELKNSSEQPRRFEKQLEKEKSKAIERMEKNSEESEEEEEFFDAPQEKETGQEFFDSSHKFSQEPIEQTREAKLEELVKQEKSKLSTNLQENLDNLLDTQEQLILLEDSNLGAVVSSVEQQLGRFKTKFQGTINSNKLAEICQIKIEITREKKRHEEIKTKQIQLEKLKNSAKNKLAIDLQEVLDNLLESQKQLALLESSGLASVISIAKQQLQRNEQKLSAKLSRLEITNLCQVQVELVRLEEDKQEQKLSAQIQLKTND